MKTLKKYEMTHEHFIRTVVGMVQDYAPQWARVIGGIKLCYGSGPRGVRGICYYDRWQNGEPHAAPLVEIAAFGEESWIQLVGTTIHELGHVVAGPLAGHDNTWKDHCAQLGLVGIKAAGTDYTQANFDPDLWDRIMSIPKPDDGMPVNTINGGLPGNYTIKRTRGCSQGIGTKGGTSRGTGSGSRMKKVVCGHEGCGYTLRMTRTWIGKMGPPICPGTDGTPHGVMECTE